MGLEGKSKRGMHVHVCLPLSLLDHTLQNDLRQVVGYLHAQKESTDHRLHVLLSWWWYKEML